jgi:DsbC/DsbD-like thiol-disulfide interchange protein
MNQRIGLASALLGAALLICAACSVQAGGQKSDSKVKITAHANPANSSGKQTITVTLVHEKGWHTYANPVDNKDFATNKTVLTVLANGKSLDAKVEYPVGRVVKDTVVGDYKVYENKVDIKANIQRAPGSTGPLEISVRILACSEKGICLLPATVKVPVP